MMGTLREWMSGKEVGNKLEQLVAYKCAMKYLL